MSFPIIRNTSSPFRIPSPPNRFKISCVEKCFMSQISDTSHTTDSSIQITMVRGTSRPNSKRDAATLWRTDANLISYLGAEVAGSIVADMTFLRTEGRIQPISPEAGELGKRHYKVEFDLVMIVDGRNLRYEARYPMGEEGQVRQSGQVCIAAAFDPGTM
jgi:hypothetical protein